MSEYVDKCLAHVRNDFIKKNFQEPTEEEQTLQYREDNWDNPIMRVKFLYQDAIEFTPLESGEAVEIFNFFHTRLYGILKDFGEA